MTIFKSDTLPTGRSGPAMWVPFSRKRDFSLPLEKPFGQGIALVGFGPDVDFDSKTTPPWILRWNSDKTEGSVIISTYYGGVKGTGYRAVVHKFGGEWVVTSLTTAYIS